MRRPTDRVFLYFLTDPRTPRWPRYVGTTINPADREHSHAKLCAGNATFGAWKKELRAAGLAPRLTILAAFPDRKTAESAEWRLIDRWKRRGLCDCNTGRTGGFEKFSLSCTGYRRRWAAEASAA